MLKKGRDLPHQANTIWTLAILVFLAMVIILSAYSLTGSSYAESTHLDELSLATFALIFTLLCPIRNLPPLVSTARVQGHIRFFDPPEI
jgi:hypothetical protein